MDENKMLNDIRQERQIRTFTIGEKRAIDEENRTVELSFSSDVPYERYWGVEILDHSPENIRMSRLNQKSPFLYAHDSRDQIGVIERAWVEGNKGKALVRLSKSARGEEMFQDIKDGIRELISVGYMVHNMVLEEQKDNGPDVYRVTDWEPYEISLVSVPADISVGIGKQLEPTINKNIKEKVNMDEPKVINEPVVDVKAEREKAQKDERHRVQEINAVAAAFGMQSEAMEAIEKGTSVFDFQKSALKKLETKQHIDAQQNNIGLDGPELRDYSIVRAIRAVSEGNHDLAGMEMEASREYAKKNNLPVRSDKFYIPGEVLRRNIRIPNEALNNMQRILTSSGASGLVGTDHMAMNFIDALRAQSVIFQLGALQLNGLQGDVSIPKQSGVSTVEIVAESGTGTYGDPAFTSVTMTPYDLRGKVIFTRQLLQQSDPSIDGLIMTDLMKESALAIDYYALQGTGSSQPTGILNTSGVGSVDGSTINWAKVVEFEKDVLEANGNIGSMAWAMRPSVNAILKTRKKDDGSGIFLSQDGRINDYPFLTTTKMPVDNLLFGAFSSLVVGFWGALEVQVDPYTAADNGRIVVRTFQFFDVAVRQAAAFSVATSVN